MTTYTRADLAARVLRDLGLYAPEESIDGNDQEWAEETIASVTAQLAAEGITIWNGSDEALPLEYLVCLSKRIGLDIGPSFGLFSVAESEAAKPVANATLRRLAASLPTGSVLETEYF